jgi:creatinine amidohydrolase/Fe(II)-dependent formamide hydrolase-like protein
LKVNDHDLKLMAWRSLFRHALRHTLALNGHMTKASFLPAVEQDLFEAFEQLVDAIRFVHRVNSHW